ncbi:methyltransferase domain-containing protein [Kineococcus glutinatus]|uniref:Streptomycin biosynthesis protein StrF domain-containing protein n=1 Tax=Kineococcus glutinatus TaxID=1070872 RepID=A0ABP9HAH4_9ACTN
MIAFGICIGDEEKYARFAAPGIAAHGEPGSPIAESRDNPSIFPAYNEILDAFRDADDLEALVLLHDDVEIRDPHFGEKVRKALSDPEVAVVGVVGARGVTSLAWWEGEGAGRCAETRGLVDFGGGEHDVDSVDGLLLVLSPWAVRNLRFDEHTFHGFHGYDADLCFGARAAGKRVRVAEIDVFHHTKGGFGDVEAYGRADAAFRAKWSAGGQGTPPRHAAGAERCPACRGELTTPGGAQPQRVRCPSCATLTTLPQPAEPPQRTELQDRQETVRRLTGRPQWYREAAHRVGWLQLHRPEGALLDAGAGTGEFAKSAQDAGYTVVAVEASPAAAAACEELDLPVLQGTLTDLRQHLHDGTMDAVAAWHQLQRAPEPAAWLADVAALLKRGGHLVLEVPNAESWTAGEAGGGSAGSDGDDVHVYSERGLRLLLDRHGFDVVTALQTTTRVYDPVQVWAQKSTAWRRARRQPPLELLRVVAVKR